MSSPPPAEPSPPAHRVTLVAFDGMQLLDLAGPLEVLAAANQAGATPPYELVVSTPGGGAVRTSSGARAMGDGGEPTPVPTIDGAVALDIAGMETILIADGTSFATVTATDQGGSGAVVALAEVVAENL